MKKMYWSLLISSPTYIQRGQEITPFFKVRNSGAVMTILSRIVPCESWLRKALCWWACGTDRVEIQMFLWWMSSGCWFGSMWQRCARFFFEKPCSEYSLSTLQECRDRCWWWWSKLEWQFCLSGIMLQNILHCKNMLILTSLIQRFYCKY